MKQLWQRSWKARAMAGGALIIAVAGVSLAARLAAHDNDEDEAGHLAGARHAFERETFGGNGRTCLTCHSRDSGTVSPEDAQSRLARRPNDPLFRGDGSDDGAGHGVQRMLADATVLVR